MNVLAKVKRQYILFFVVIVLLFGVKQIVTLMGIADNSDFAELLNIAGRQRMLSQKVTKLLLYEFTDSLDNRNYRAELIQALDQWQSSHQHLIQENSQHIEDATLDSLLMHNERLIYNFSLLENERLNSSLLIKAQSIEREFLKTMELAVGRLQFLAEEQLFTLKYIEIALSIFFILAIFSLFVLIVQPYIKALASSNKSLSNTNSQLLTAEEELRSNLEYLTVLQDSLEKKEHQNRIFIQQAPIPIVMLNVKAEILAASSEWLKAHRLIREDVQGKCVFDVQPSLREFWEPVFNDVLEGKVRKNEGQEFLTDSGSKFWLDWEIRPWFISEGKIGGGVLTFNDITEKKKLEIERARIENNIRLTNRAAQIGYWELNAVTNEISWSEETKEIHDAPADYNPNLAIGLNFYKEGTSKDAISLAVQNAMNSGTKWDLELQIITLKGVEKWVRTIGMAKMVEGKCVSIYGTFQDINDRKRQELKVQNEKDKNENLLKGTNAGTWEWDVSKDVLILNERWAEIIGYTLAELAPITFKVWEDAVHPDDGIKTNELLKKCWDKELPFYEAEVRMKHKKGHWVWVYTRGKVFSWNDDGSPAKMFGTHIDISKQKARQIQFENFISQSPTAVAMFDVHLNYLAASDKWIQDYDLSKVNITGRSLYNVFSSNLDHWRDIHQQCLKGATMKGVDSQYINKKGQLIWLNWEIKPWYDDEEIGGVIIHTEDVTERKVLEQENRRIQSVFELTNQIVRLGVWDYDVKLDQLYWSDATKEIHQVPYDYEPNISDAILFYEEGESRNTMSKVLRDAQQTGKSYDVELKIITKDGGGLWVRTVGRPIFDGATCVKVMGVIMDVDDAYRYKSKEMVVRKNRLQIANNALIKRNTKLSDFAQITSHNLRAPVSNLKSLIELMKNDLMADQQELILQKVEKVTSHLDNTLNTLVESLKTNEVNPNDITGVFFQEILDKVLVSIDHLVLQSGIQIRANFQELPFIKYNPMYLESILFNLITNSITYKSNERKPIVIIKTFELNGKYYLEVQDNGLGIDMKKYGEKVFGLNKTFHNNSGTKGIGLYMTKQQVVNMGGTIDLESEVDNGTTFAICFNDLKIER